MVCSNWYTWHVMTTLFNQVEWAQWWPEGRKNITVFTTPPQGDFWHISVNAQRRLWQCGQNLCRRFLRAILPTTVWLCAQAMVGKRKTKRLRTPSPRWISDMFESVQNGDQDGVVRIFVGLSVSSEVSLITLHYNAQHSFLYTRSVINFLEKWSMTVHH